MTFRSHYSLYSYYCFFKFNTFSKYFAVTSERVCVCGKGRSFSALPLIMESLNQTHLVMYPTFITQSSEVLLSM